MPYEVEEDGNCSICQESVNDADTLKCWMCNVHFHALCSTKATFCNRSFLGSFKKVKSKNFPFVCDSCVTKHECKEASQVTDQIRELSKVVGNLVTEVQLLKAEPVKKTGHQDGEVAATENKSSVKTVWQNNEKLQLVKSSL